VDFSASKFFRTYFFAGYCFYNLRASYEHVARSFCHKDKIRQGRRIDSTSSTRPHNHGDLRDDSRCQRIAIKNLTIARECIYTFLYSRPARVVYSYQWTTNFDCEIHDLAYFCRMHLTKASAHHRKILGKNTDISAIDHSIACNDSFTRSIDLVHTELGSSVFDKGVEFHEGAWV